jgi:polygalacturonase
MSKYLTPFYLLLFLLISLPACRKGDDALITEKTPWGEEHFSVPSFPHRDFSITDYDARPVDGYNNQKAIQSAIDECSRKGGGRVVIPAGRWMTSYLTLRSHVNLYLREEAELFFFDSVALYAVPTFTRWEGIECMNYHPLIYARDAEDIAITGPGKINGNGRSWWWMKKVQLKTLTHLYDQVEAGVPPEERNCLAYEGGSLLRPSMIQTVNCKNVLIDSVKVLSGPMWSIHFVYCENVVARNIRVFTVGTNNDGITPDASKRVLIKNCFFSTGDDCIVIKSGLNEDGWRVGKASERIVIHHCSSVKGHGGVVIGSEMSGGVRNVYAHDCSFRHTITGLRIKSMPGRGGVVENIWFKNIALDSIPGDAIQLTMDYGASSIMPRSKKPPEFRNIFYDHISILYARHSIMVKGLPHQKVENLSFRNLQMKDRDGSSLNHVATCTFRNVSLVSANDPPVVLRDCDTLVMKETRFIHEQ